jgi:hypothetical protein
MGFVMTWPPELMNVHVDTVEVPGIAVARANRLNFGILVTSYGGALEESPQFLHGPM